MNILVLCTGNSARSVLLEAILDRDPRINAFSAGSKPAGKVHPQSLILLAGLGYDTAPFRSKSWDEFAESPKMDAVITVCGNAAGETCPIWPGAPVRAHWGVEDPAAAAESEWKQAFEMAYQQLKSRAEALLSLPFETYDQAALKQALDRIATE